MQSNTRLKLSQVSMQISIAAIYSLVLSSQVALAEEPAEEVLPEYTFMDAIKTGKNLTSFRLRYEFVEQDGNQAGNNANTAIPLEDAHAVTLRSLVGWQTAPYKNWSFGVQLVNLSKLVDDYNDHTIGNTTTPGTNDPSRVKYAKILDPDYTNINQAYIDWTGIKNTKFRLGRQVVNLDNVRFIGDIAFRQVMQTFDGLSVMTKAIPDTEVFLGHYGALNQITTRHRSNGDLNVINAKYFISPTETFSGYAYLSSFDDLGFGNGWFGLGTLNNGTRPNATANQSNKIFGARLDGIHPFNPNLRAVYTAEYAKQSDYSGGDARIDAHYYKVGGGVGIDFLTLRLDQELLSSNNGLFAFQTPFGTNHLFQGWVDKFLATPKEGMRDTFATATYRYNDFLFFADYHVFQSDVDFFTVGGGAARNGNQYGTEWNVAATYNYSKNIMAKFEYGKYSESDLYQPTATPTGANRIRDTEKLWLTAMYTF